MQYSPHVEIRIANFFVKRLGIIGTKHIENTIGDIGGSILRSGDIKRGGRNFSADHSCKMIGEKTSLSAIATSQIDQWEP